MDLFTGTMTATSTRTAKVGYFQMVCTTRIQKSRQARGPSQEGDILPACLQVPKVSNGEVDGFESRVDLLRY